jgi:hypothetical protein
MNPDSMNEVIEGAKSCGYNLPADVAVEHMKRTETMGATSHGLSWILKPGALSKSKLSGANRYVVLTPEEQQCLDWRSFVPC